MLMVACRLMTSGVNGVSLLGSSVFKFCTFPEFHDATAYLGQRTGKLTLQIKS